MIRFCKCCKEWHDLDEPWPEICRPQRMGATAIGLQIIKDIEPYKAVAGDVALRGKNPVIGSRSAHKEFLKRNKYVEVGNEPIKPPKSDYGPEVTEREVRQVYERLRDQR